MNDDVAGEVNRVGRMNQHDNEAENHFQRPPHTWNL